MFSFICFIICPKEDAHVKSWDAQLLFLLIVLCHCRLFHITKTNYIKILTNIRHDGAQNVVYFLFFGIIFLRIVNKARCPTTIGRCPTANSTFSFPLFWQFLIIILNYFQIVFELDTNVRTFSFICFVICPNEDAHVKSWDAQLFLLL